MDMHSDIMSDTGSIATETGRLRYCMREESRGFRRGVGVSSGGATAGSMSAASCASRLMLKARALLLVLALLQGVVLFDFGAAQEASKVLFGESEGVFLT